MELKSVRPQRQTDKKYFSHLFHVICFGHLRRKDQCAVYILFLSYMEFLK